MKIEQSLFEAGDICLAPIDHEKDPEVEARWTQDTVYMRLISLDPARPMSAAQIKKRYEKIEKDQEEGHNLYHFTIRMRSDDRLIGFEQLYWIDWSNGAANILVGIGSADDRGKGYGTQALELLLRFAFHELNLYRLSAPIPEYNPAARHIFEKAGFQEEVRWPERVYRDARWWDLAWLGLLRDEWERNQSV